MSDYFTRYLLAQEPTTEILKVYGLVPYKNGLTYQQAWNATEDKNTRYSIRLALLGMMEHIKD